MASIPYTRASGVDATDLSLQGDRAPQASLGHPKRSRTSSSEVEPHFFFSSQVDPSSSTQHHFIRPVSPGEATTEEMDQVIPGALPNGETSKENAEETTARPPLSILGAMRWAVEVLGDYARGYLVSSHIGTRKEEKSTAAKLRSSVDDASDKAHFDNFSGEAEGQSNDTTTTAAETGPFPSVSVDEDETSTRFSRGTAVSTNPSAGDGLSSQSLPHGDRKEKGKMKERFDGLEGAARHTGLKTKTLSPQESTCFFYQRSPSLKEHHDLKESSRPESLYAGGTSFSGADIDDAEEGVAREGPPISEVDGSSSAGFVPLSQQKSEACGISPEGIAVQNKIQQASLALDQDETVTETRGLDIPPPNKASEEQEGNGRARQRKMTFNTGKPEGRWPTAPIVIPPIAVAPTLVDRTSPRLLPASPLTEPATLAPLLPSAYKPTSVGAATGMTDSTETPTSPMAASSFGSSPAEEFIPRAPHSTREQISGRPAHIIEPLKEEYTRSVTTEDNFMQKALGSDPRTAEILPGYPSATVLSALVRERLFDDYMRAAGASEPVQMNISSGRPSPALWSGPSSVGIVDEGFRSSFKSLFEDHGFPFVDESTGSNSHSLAAMPSNASAGKKSRNEELAATISRTDEAKGDSRVHENAPKLPRN